MPPLPQPQWGFPKTAPIQPHTRPKVSIVFSRTGEVCERRADAGPDPDPVERQGHVVTPTTSEVHHNKPDQAHGRKGEIPPIRAVTRRSPNVSGWVFLLWGIGGNPQDRRVVTLATYRGLRK